MTNIDDILEKCRKTLPSPFHATTPTILAHVMTAADRVNQDDGIAPDYGDVLEAARLLFIEYGVCDPALATAPDEAGTGAPAPADDSITAKETEALVTLWRDRDRKQGYPPQTRRYADMEIEFFVGAFALLTAQGRTYPPFWNILIMSGRSLSATIRPETPVAPDAKEGA